MFSFQCGKEEKNDPILENVSLLLFRFVWKNQIKKPKKKEIALRVRIFDRKF